MLALSQGWCNNLNTYTWPFKHWKKPRNQTKLKRAYNFYSCLYSLPLNKSISKYIFHLLFSPWVGPYKIVSLFKVSNPINSSRKKRKRTLVFVLHWHAMFVHCLFSWCPLGHGGGGKGGFVIIFIFELDNFLYPNVGHSIGFMCTKCGVGVYFYELFISKAWIQGSL